MRLGLVSDTSCRIGYPKGGMDVGTRLEVGIRLEVGTTGWRLGLVGIRLEVRVRVRLVVAGWRLQAGVDVSPSLTSRVGAACGARGRRPWTQSGTAADAAVRQSGTAAVRQSGTAADAAVTAGLSTDHGVLR